MLCQGKNSGKDANSTADEPEDIIPDENWTKRATNDPTCLNGCGDVAKRIQSLIGGQVHRITANGRFMGRFDNRAKPSWDFQSHPWDEHFVVVKDGRVYDAFTGGKGVDIKTYKSWWQYADVIDFGF